MRALAARLVVYQRAPRGSLRVLSGSSCCKPLFIPCSSNTSRRMISWNPLKWGRSDLGRSTSPSLEDELPTIFSDQPVEVEDYVRPDKSLFEKMEDLWDWLLSFLQPIEKQVDILRGMHENGLFGVDLATWGHVLVLYGICLRLVTLAPSLYSHRNSLRMNRISAQISELNNAQNKAKNDRTLSTSEKRLLKEGYSRMKQALCKREGCSQWRSFGGALSAPLTTSAFLAIRRLTLYEGDLHQSSFLWIADLTLPDPTFLLPIICAGLFLFNFELSQRMQRGGRSAGGLYIRWGTRAGAAVGVYIFSGQPAALFAYWIGLSCMGLLQPLLLRWQPFRDLFRFPDPPDAAKSQIVGKTKKDVWATSQKVRSESDESTHPFERIDDFEVAFEEPKRDNCAFFSPLSFIPETELLEKER